jgi:glycosyltransferase involved in cell wall biosynthesis
MKLLHVNEYLSGGGAEFYLNEFIEEANKRNHRNILLYGEGSKNDIPKSAAKSYFIDQIAKANCTKIKLKLDKVKKILKIENPDVIYFHQVYNYDLIKYLINEKPSIRYIHDLKLICPDGKKTLKSINSLCKYPLGYRCQLRSYCFRCMPRNPKTGIPLIYNSKRIIDAFRKESNLVVSSKFMKQALIENNFLKDKINVIPYFTSIPKLNLYNYEKLDPLILFVGRIVEEKGVQFILKVLPKIKRNAKLMVVGHGPYLEQIKKTTEELNLSNRVIFKGWLSHSKLDAIYRQCNLLVLPSIWPEPFGIVGIEAMSYQKPVIAFNVGGISEWCKNGKVGFLVDPCNESEFAKKINLLLKNNTLSEKMGTKGRAIVKERFVSSIHFDRFFSILEKKI